MSYKSTDDLMQHLQDNGITIGGEAQKRQLINTGYFHGYKGYRFFKTARHPIPFTNYSDIYATIKYDSEIKALFYEQIMFIETAVKNIALQRIMLDANSERIQQMYRCVVVGYNSFPQGTGFKTRKKAQIKKLRLEKDIHSSLVGAYTKGEPVISHFYNKYGYDGVPLWALFEIITLGTFANLLSCLEFSTREHITSDLGMSVTSVDTNRELIYKYLYALKDLRNAIAHNAVVFDARFRKFDPSPAMRQCLKSEFNLPYVNFKTIGDYLILICYYLKLLDVSRTDIRALIDNFKRITDVYVNTVDANVSKTVIHPDLGTRIAILENSI